MKHEPTIKDVFDSIQVFSTDMDRQFKEVRQEFDQVHKELSDIRKDFGTISRQSNTKMTVLVDTLVSKKILDSKDAERILALEPYPQN
jgi:archaellum component FlaC